MYQIFTQSDISTGATEGRNIPPEKDDQQSQAPTVNTMSSLLVTLLTAIVLRNIGTIIYPISNLIQGVHFFV